MQPDTDTTVNKSRQLPEPFMAKVFEFNFLPSRYVHMSWLQTLPHGRLLSKLRRCERAEWRVARYLLSYFGLRERYWFDFNKPSYRIALWDSRDIQQLAVYVGLTLNYQYIQHAVRRDDVLHIRRAFGERAYRFAMRQAPFLVPKEMLSRGEINPTNDRDMIAASGVHCLGTVFCTLPLELHKRLLLKLPYHWMPHFCGPPVQSRQNCALLLSKLMPELQKVKKEHG